MKNTLWEREDIINNGLNQDQLAFLTDCMNENLNHARHVENERLTFNSIYMALVAGALAFVFSLENRYFSAGLTFILILLGFIAMLLTKRWDNTFDAHIKYAKDDYRLIHLTLFPRDANNDGDIDERERIQGLSEVPAYCFRPKDPKFESAFMKSLMKIRTRRLFFYFYLLIQLILFVSLIYFIYDILT